MFYSPLWRSLVFGTFRRAVALQDSNPYPNFICNARSGDCPLVLHLLRKIASQKMSGNKRLGVPDILLQAKKKPGPEPLGEGS